MSSLIVQSLPGRSPGLNSITLIVLETFLVYIFLLPKLSAIQAIKWVGTSEAGNDAHAMNLTIFKHANHDLAKCVLILLGIHESHDTVNMRSPLRSR